MFVGSKKIVIMSSSHEESSQGSGSEVSRRSSTPTKRQRNRIINDMIDKRLRKVVPPKKKKERTFKYVSNKEQFQFNEEILEELERVKAEGKSKGRIKDTIRKLTKRNKLIKMADRSKAGWKIVEEYLTDDAASDDEDDRKIKKAEKRALQKMEEEREKKKKQSGSNSRSQSNTYNSSKYAESPPRGRFRNASRYGRSRRDDMCFRCGKTGHWDGDCYSYRRSDAPRGSGGYSRR